MAEQIAAPSVPPQPWFDPKTGNATEAFRRFIIGERGRTRNVNTGVSALQSAVEDVQTTSIQQVAAANQAASAAIASGGSTVTDYASATNQTVNSGTFATFLTCDITTTGAGNHTITAALGPTVFSTTALISSGLTFSGDWQIIENAGANVLFSGTFTVTQTLNGGEGGDPFYTYDITFGTALPSEDAAASVGVGAVTVELQLRRASGTNAVSGLSLTQLVEWA
jgi:hypothetical protein